MRSIVKKFMKNGRIFIALTLLLSAATMALTTWAQGGDEPEPDQPDRGEMRPAPYREPEILRQTAASGESVASTVIALPPIADAYIASGRPFENFGADALYLGYNLVGQNNFGAERMLLRFDVDTYVPEGAVINSAALQLRLSFSSPAEDAPMGTLLRRLAAPWTEFGVTWNNQPAWAGAVATTDVGSTLDWYEWDVTDIVSDWANDVTDNDGVEIIGDEAVQQRERAFYARETTTDYYPRLVINYTDTGDTMPPIVTADALPQYSRRNFSVTWSGSDQGLAGIDYYDVQVRIDGGAWQDWQMGVVDTSAEYVGAENGRLYEFRARGVDNVGNVEPFAGPEASTTADTMPPTTTVDPLPALVNVDSITVSWTGSDDVSGIQYYDVYWREGSGAWVLWQKQTLATSIDLMNVEDGLYQFEARAVDNLDHVEPFQEQAEASVIIDADPPFVTPRIWMPLIASNASMP